MKKKILIACLLCLVALFTVACGEKDNEDKPCKHTNLTESAYEPDCSLEGYIQHLCLDCGYTYKSDIKAPTGHKMITSVDEATCTEQGCTTYTCSVCGYSYSASYVEPAGHTFTSKITPQTCTEQGFTTYTCTCGYSYKTADVVPNGHNFKTTPIEPTCTEQGHTLYSCNNCDYEYKTAFTSSAHVYKAKITAPNCTEKGFTTYTCSVCGHSYITSEVAPLGHTFTTTTITPSFNTTGCTVYTCKCGFSYVADYVWYSNLFSGVSGNESKTVARGVDLSYHNGTVNFTALANAGIDFVILRVGYSGSKDTKFEEYYSAARRAGLDIGAYFYTYATTVSDLADDTKEMMKHLEGKQFEYPIYLDLEDDSLKNLSRDVMMDMCTTFCELLAEKRYYPGVYANKNWIENKLDAEQLAARFEVWMAHYPTNIITYGEDYYSGDYNMWQYTETGTANGVTGYVDRNICYKDYPSIIKKYGYNGYGD